MSFTRTISVVLPEVLADDVEYYTEECGLYMDAVEFVRDAARSLLMDVVAGYKGEIDEAYTGYLMIREAHPETRRFELTVPESMAVDIERFILPLGYDMNKFVGIAALRNVERVNMYQEDVDERVGNRDVE